MHTKNSFSLIAALSAAVLLFSGCEGGGDDGGDDTGDNNAELVICLGDSITQGYGCDGAPYPSHLAGMTGKTVLNYGSGGETAQGGAGRISGALAKKPGYICILYGANDAIAGRDPGVTKENIRSMIAACKANHTVPIVGTIPPMTGEHCTFDGNARAINEAIRAAASEEGATCVDLYGAFGNGDGYLASDGLHPNAAGSELIAKCFAGAI